MESKYSVSLKKIVDTQNFEVLNTPKNIEHIFVTTPDVNRPALVLAGDSDYFDPERIQFFGIAEASYAAKGSDEDSVRKLTFLFSKKPVAVIITRNQEVLPHFLELAKEYDVPVLRSSSSTSDCMAAIISFLGVELAPRITRHGVLIEVHGEGVLIVGESGVGKSETALELLKRGHRLIADDAVEIKRVSSKSLVGSAPDNIRHFIEVRGVGIINARRIFGVGAVKMTEKIDMVIKLEPWENGKVYDRLGIENDVVDILGVEVPISVVPVQPGRNLSIIIEAAAMNNRQKKMGYNAARQLLHNLGMTDEIIPEKKELELWDDFE